MKLGQLLEELRTGMGQKGIYLIKSQKDYEDLEKASRGVGEIRFIADDTNKDLYVFHTDLLHEEVGRKLYINIYSTSDPIIAGVAEIRTNNDKWVTTKIYNLESNMEASKRIKKIAGSRLMSTFNGRHTVACLEANWNWVDPYISVTPYINKLKIEWENVRANI